MIEWNVPKIREKCLKLMGFNADTFGRDGKPIVWEGPRHAKHCFYDEETPLGEPGRLPDPTKSIDDALPLMERYRLILTRLDNGWFVESVVFAAFDDSAEAMSDTAPLAVCLCALRCAGHILDDFRVRT